MERMVSAAVLPSVLCCCFLACAATTTTTTGSPSLTCAGSGSPPVMLGEPLRFCGYAGISCCSAVDDDALRDELDALNLSDATCAAIV